MGRCFALHPSATGTVQRKLLPESLLGGESNNTGVLFQPMQTTKGPELGAKHADKLFDRVDILRTVWGFFGPYVYKYDVNSHLVDSVSFSICAR